MTTDRIPCPICDGVKTAPCSCSDYCRSPEGLAYGRMGHGDIECGACDEDGTVAECCGLPECECRQRAA